MPTRDKPSVSHRAFVMRSLLLTLCLLGPISVARAQQPNSQVLAFSGNIPNQPDGPVIVRMRLYNDNSAGTLLFEETQTVSVTSQTFMVRIGDATTGGVPATVFRDNTSLWIAFALDSAPDMEVGPRTAITSGGYAHAAALLSGPLVRTLNGVVGDVSLAAGANVAITPNGNTLTIDAAGSGGLPSVSHDATLSGNGTSGSPLGVAANGITNAQVANGALSPAKITGGAATVGANTFTGTQVIATGDLYVGNVTNPAFAGNKSIYFENQGGNAQNSFRINAGAAGGYPDDNLFLVGYSNTGSTRGTGIKFFTALPGGLQVEAMTINSQGQVGIGTSSPGVAKLAVVGTSGAPAVSAVNTNDNGLGVLGSSNASVGGTGVYGDSSRTGAGVVGYNSGTGYGLSGSSANGYGVYGDTITGWAGYFHGRVGITLLGAAGGTSLCRNANNEIAACSSSLRYKTDVQPFAGGLDIVNRLRPITFTWKEGGAHDVGLAAEDVEEVEPLLTFRNDKGEIEGVKYNQLSVVFVNALIEQQSQLQRQRDEIQQQRERLTTQQHELAALKTLVCQLRPAEDVCK